MRFGDCLFHDWLRQQLRSAGEPCYFSAWQPDVLLINASASHGHAKKSHKVAQVGSVRRSVIKAVLKEYR